MFLPYHQLVVILVIILLLLLGIWGGRKFISRRRRLKPSESDIVLPPSPAEKSDVDESQILRTYFRGLSYVIANETDKAVAEFVKVAQVNTTTAEIYLALGQLFRNTGELERAIRVHRDILLRPNLPDDVRRQTFFEIGLDYKKAGFFDRACRTFEEILEQEPKNQGARRELSSLYIGMREWEKALDLCRNLPATLSETNVLAHLTTEVAKTAVQTGDRKKALKLFQKALELNENCIDTWLHYGDYLLDDNQTQKALEAWEKAFSINPEFTEQVIKRIMKLSAGERESKIEEFFSRHRDNYGETKEFNLAHINWQIQSGRFQEAKSQLRQLLEQNNGDRRIFQLTKQLVQAAEPETGAEFKNSDLIKAFFATDFRFEKVYHCQKCGYKLDQMAWRCPRCSSWDSISPR